MPLRISGTPNRSRRLRARAGVLRGCPTRRSPSSRRRSALRRDPSCRRSATSTGCRNSSPRMRRRHLAAPEAAAAHRRGRPAPDPAGHKSAGASCPAARPRPRCGGAGRQGGFPRRERQEVVVPIVLGTADECDCSHCEDRGCGQELRDHHLSLVLARLLGFTALMGLVEATASCVESVPECNDTMSASTDLLSAAWLASAVVVAVLVVFVVIVLRRRRRR